jgi:hypothetical protein
MSIERIYYCDGPDCEVHVGTATPPPYLPSGIMELRGNKQTFGSEPMYFCGWDCLMKHAATFPPEERIEIRPEENPDA